MTRLEKELVHKLFTFLLYALSIFGLFVIAGLLLVHPTPKNPELIDKPFDSVDKQVVVDQLGSGVFVDDHTYRVCQQGWWWYALSGGGFITKNERCWK